MNIPLLLAIFTSALPALAETHDPDAVTPPKSAKWTVTGNWLAKHPNWTDTITIRPDGTFARAAGDGGKWRLTGQEDHPALELNWDSWNPETIDLVSPNLLRGSTRAGALELRRVAGDAAPVAAAKPQPEQAKEFDDPALKARLKDSVWLLQDGKQFTLKANGSTSGDWHDRKGFWRIVGPNKVQLTILWRLKPPVTVSVEANGSLLRWPDAEWAQIAKRLEVDPVDPETAK